MKVKELIDRLSAFDAKAEVCITTDLPECEIYGGNCCSDRCYCPTITAYTNKFDVDLIVITKPNYIALEFNRDEMKKHRLI